MCIPSGGRRCCFEAYVSSKKEEMMKRTIVIASETIRDREGIIKAILAVVNKRPGC